MFYKNLKRCCIPFILISLLLNFTVVKDAYSDIVKSIPVGPGVTHTEIIRPEGPWVINVLTVDLTSQYITLESVKANDRLYSLEKTSSMTERKNYQGHTIIGAINGDFYNVETGQPIGTQIINGMILQQPFNRSVFGITVYENPFIEIFTMTGRLYSREGNSFPIWGVNRDRYNNEILMFNTLYGPGTKTPPNGTEISLKVLNNYSVNDTMRGVVMEIDSLYGNNYLQDSIVVLSGQGSGSEFLKSYFNVGDTVLFYIQFPQISEPIIQAIGGLPRIVRDGKISIETEREGGAGFAKQRHPRTAIGYSKDGKTVYFVTVDGRQQGYSEGMTLSELAGLLIELGAYQGINLDGGGSTTMIVRGEIANSPSDPGGERSVSNAIMIVSSAPHENLFHLWISPEKLSIYKGSSYKFTASGFDRFYNPVDLSDSTFFWRCDSSIGIIDSSGLFIASSSKSRGFVILQIGEVTDSTLVSVEVLESIALSPDQVILNVGEGIQIIPRAVDTGGNVVQFPLNMYNWSVSGNVGEIDSTGYFTAEFEGAGYIRAQIDSVYGMVSVSVGINDSIGVILDPFNETSDWNLSGVEVDLFKTKFLPDSSLFISEPSSGKLRYSFKRSGGSSVVYLDKDFYISGTPGALSLWIYGNGKGHYLEMQFDDSEAEKFYLRLSKNVDWDKVWKHVEVPFYFAMPGWENPGATLDYPVTLKRLRILLGGGELGSVESDEIFFDDLQVRYFPVSNLDDFTGKVPSDYKLFQNYPNPFNRYTVIRFFLPEDGFVSLDVYDILGKNLRKLVKGYYRNGMYKVIWHGRNDKNKTVSSGIYFYRFTVRDAENSEPCKFQSTRKLILLN